MIGAGILDFLSGINLYGGRLDEDFIDRLNNSWSSYILIVTAIIITAKQMFGSAISCWFPAEFPKPWMQFAENYCWVKNTYFVRSNESIPVKLESRKQAELAYYQWVPFVLAIQALLFYIPAMFWRLTNWQTGINIESLLRVASDGKTADDDKVKKIESTLNQNFAFHHTKRKKLSYQAYRTLLAFNGNQSWGYYLVALYLMTKTLYIANSIGQFFLVKAFVGLQHHNFYGIEVLSEIFSGKEWHITGHFPRITLCDFNIRSFGQWHNYSVQCVLPVNMLNEKLYIFIFFWLLFVTTLTCMSLLYWIYRIFIQDGTSLLKKYICSNKQENLIVHEETIKNLAVHDLKKDGIFVLRLMTFNVGEYVSSRVILKLYKDRYEPNVKSDPKSDGSKSDKESDLKSNEFETAKKKESAPIN